MLDVVRELGWQDIGIVHVDTVDMRDRKKQFLGMAGTQDICVVSVIAMDEDMANVPQVIRDLFNLKVRGKHFGRQRGLVQLEHAKLLTYSDEFDSGADTHVRQKFRPVPHM